MRIIADARWCANADGIGRFAREVMRRIPELIPVAVNTPTLALLEPLTLGRAARRQWAELYFSPAFNPPFRPGCPVVLTLHDLIHVEVDAESSPAKRAYYRFLVLPAVRRAEAVLTVSTFSRERILAWSGIAPERVIVVGNGVDKAFQPTGARHRESFDYILYVGNRKPHKNLPALFAAFANIAMRCDWHLVLSGHPDPGTTAMVEKLKLQDRVHYAGFIAEAELPAWYRGARCLVMPSLYEGFGLPAAEAMACGTPVIVANRTSLPEVVGDVGLVFDPDDVDALATALLRLQDDPQLAASLAQAGPKRAVQFDWDRVAAAVRPALHLQ